MSSNSGIVVSYCLNSVWEVALIAAAGWLASRLLRRLGPRTEHTVWVSTLMLAVVMPALPFLRRLIAMLIIPQMAGQQSSIAVLSVQGGAAGQAGVHALSSPVLWAILALYCGSILYFTARLLRSLHGAARLVRQASPLSLTPVQEEMWQRCKRSFSLDKARILASPQVSGPVALGLQEPALLVPPEFAANCTPHDFLAALAHECAHMMRRDFQKNIFYEALGLLLAFHPVSWALKAQIAQTREMVCDGMAAEMMDSHSYAQSLLRLAAMVAAHAQFATTHAIGHAIGIFDANILEKRIMRMTLKRQHISTFLKYGLIVPAMLFLLSVAVGGAAMAVTIEPQSAAQKVEQTSPYGPVYKIGKGVSAPVPLNRVEAKFPKSGHYAKGFQAIVIARLIVDAEGMPRDIRITRSYNKDFDAEAIKAVKRYRFKPAMRQGKPVAVAIATEIQFKMH